MTHALSYVRLSSADGRQFRRENPGATTADLRVFVSRSIANQLEHNRERLAAAGDILDSECIDDGISGQSVRRRGMDALLTRARELRAQGHTVRVWMKNSRRLARDVDLHGWYVIELRRMGVEIVLWAEEGESKPMRRIKSVFAEMHADQCREDAVRELLKRAHAGKRNGGVLPFAIALNGERLGPKEPEASAIRLAFTRAAAGDSFVGIAAELGWRLATLRYRLRSTIYAGGVTWQRHRHVEGPNGYYARLRPRADWITVWGAAELTVSRETWQAVQERMDRAATIPRRERSGRPSLALSGLLACGACGKPLWLVGGFDGPRGHTHCYGCKVPDCRAIRAVSTFGWTASIIEAAIAGLSDEAQLAVIAEEMAAVHRSGVNLGYLEAEVARLARRERALIEALASAEASAPALGRELELTSARLANLRRELSAERVTAGRALSPEGIRAAFAAVAERLRAAATEPDLETSARTILHAAVERVTLEPDRQSGTIFIHGTANIAQPTLVGLASLKFPWVPPRRLAA